MPIIQHIQRRFRKMPTIPQDSNWILRGGSSIFQKPTLIREFLVTMPMIEHTTTIPQNPDDSTKCQLNLDRIFRFPKTYSAPWICMQAKLEQQDLRATRPLLLLSTVFCSRLHFATVLRAFLGKEKLLKHDQVASRHLLMPPTFFAK